MKINVCGRIKSEEDREHFRLINQYCLFGFNWWQWVPRVKKQHIGSTEEKEYYGYELQWLCFWIEFYDASKYWRKQ